MAKRCNRAVYEAAVSAHKRRIAGGGSEIVYFTTWQKMTRPDKHLSREENKNKREVTG